MDEKIFKAEQLAAAANVLTYPPTIGLTFTNAGNNLIYCDNPESVNLGASTLACMWGASVGTAYKDVETYAHLYNKDGSTGAFHFGIAVQNTTSSAVTITYKHAGNSCDSGDSVVKEIADDVQAAYLTGSTKTLKVAAGGLAILCSTSGKFSASNKGASLTFHSCLKASVASGVYFRVFIAGANKKNSLTELFNISKANWGGGGTIYDNMFCGEVGYSQKNCTMDAASGHTYVLNEWRPSINKNEYPSAITYIDGGLNILTGNYGVIYKMTIQNASGKRIRIVPDWTKASTATLVARFNGGAWKALGKTTTNGCWYVSLGTGSTATVETMLPGGNFGNLAVFFD